MTESYSRAVLSPFSRESWLIPQWNVVNPAEVQKMHDAAKEMNVVLYNAAFGGGGILEPSPSAVTKKGQEHFAKSKSKAVVLGHTTGSTEPNVVLHYPTNPERKHFDETFYAYQTHVGEYLRNSWDAEKLGLNPLPGIIGSTKLEDGRHVVAVRFRKNFEPLGLGGPAHGIHEMDTARITPDHLRKLVHVLDAMHTDAAAFQAWVRESGKDMPEESWLNAKNPGFAFRGKEWWISPTGSDDRIHELADRVRTNGQLYQTVDPAFDMESGIRDMIGNNIELYPHTDGSMDRPDLAADAVVVHGALYPDNIHMHKRNGSGVDFTVSGGDRAQGMGLRGQMIDWLVTSAAASPAHQEALISEYLTLHPSDKDRRALAMHVMYRSVMEAPWFARRGKLKEAGNLARLAYDIVRGNGIWSGVNTPLS